MKYDYRKLCGRIVEKYNTRAAFASAMNMSERTLSAKLTGKRGWKQDNISDACKLLDITQQEIPTYFFAVKV